MYIGFMVVCFVRNLLLRKFRHMFQFLAGMEFITIRRRSDMPLYEFGF